MKAMLELIISEKYKKIVGKMEIDSPEWIAFFEPEKE